MPSQLPPATRYLLLAFAAVFVVQQLWPEPVLARFGLWPEVGPILVAHTEAGPVYARFGWWQFLSHGFLHGGIAHLLLNGVVLLGFGPALELRWGAARFALFFALCVIGGGLAQWLLTARPVPGQGVSVTLGASGGVFGVVTVFAMLHPRQRVLLLIPPVPMPAWLLVVLFAVASTVLGVTGWVPGIAHFAHLGGMVTGLVLWFVLARHWRRTVTPSSLRNDTES
ncbi:MAG: rhomboid family intramembrane serine protease [Xanthomonadales bacterium]|nr:rhomboid family intramembrane serine protease [Xanthomonadales bacterium]